MKGARQWAGLVLLVLAALGVVGYKLISSAAHTTAQPVVTVRGLVGGEKLGLLSDERVQTILHDRYHLTVDATKAGSIEMVQGNTAGQDFLWPSSQVSLELYKLRHVGSVKSATTFNSPIVLYAWLPVYRALSRHGLVRDVNGVSYVTNFARLARMIDAGKQWKDVGLSNLYGQISIFPTDPNKSNSGMMFSGLLANTLDHTQVVDDASLPRVLPDVKRFFDRLGFLEASSSDLFDQFLKTGIGAKPIIAGYENQLIEYAIQNPSYLGLLRKNIRILYPQPTVISEHTFIALDGNGERLRNAMSDKDILQIAWTRHGFRSGIAGTQNDPHDLSVIGVPKDIPAIMPMPRFSVVQRILRTLSQG